MRCMRLYKQAQPELMPFIAAALDPGQPASLHKVCIKGEQHYTSYLLADHYSNSKQSLQRALCVLCATESLA
jgi:hypothetical protein